MHLQNTLCGENAAQHYLEYSFVCLIFLSQCAVEPDGNTIFAGLAQLCQ